jgi:Leucine-rich repeat (LRR) protein
VQGPRIKELPKEIGNMMHLRHLTVDSNDLTDLPPSIRGLLNLQTLYIKNTNVQKIDPGFWKIKTLRHVIAAKLTLPETLPEELGELQTLHGVMPAEGMGWDQHNCPLHKMTKLRSLKLLGIKHDKHGAALEDALAEMHHVCHLKLQGDVVPSSIFIAHSLRYLQKMTLDEKVKWPAVALSVRLVRPNLVRLTLKNSSEVPQHLQAELRNILGRR